MRAARATWPIGRLDELAADRRGARTSRSYGCGRPVGRACAAGRGVCGGVRDRQRAGHGDGTLLGLDPFKGTAVLARLAPDLDRTAAEPAAAAQHDP